MIEQIIKNNNASTLFMLTPVSGHEKDTLLEYQLINSYLKDVNRDDLGDNLLFVLFKPDDMEFFELFLYTESANNENYVEDYDYAGGYIVLVYKVPDWLKEDFERFKRGEYSKFSMKTKNLFSKTISMRTGLKTVTTIQWDVFSKSEELRKDLEAYVGQPISKDTELYSAPNTDRETLDITKFRNYVETLEPAANSLEVTQRGGEEASRTNDTTKRC